MTRALAAVRRFWLAFLALLRDACASLYASYPGEEVEEAFALALDEGEERGPWRTGYW